MNKGLRSGLAAIPATNISRVRVANVATAVASRINTFALPAGEGVNVIVPFTQASCKIDWPSEVLASRRRRRETNDFKAGLCIMKT